MIAVTLIRVPSYGTVSLIEFIWTMTGLITILYCVFQLRRAEFRLYDVKRSGRNGSMILLAKGYVEREIVRVLQGVCIFGIGIYADVQTAPGGVNYITPAGIVITFALFMLGVLVVFQSVSDAMRAKKVSNVLYEQIMHKEAK